MKRLILTILAAGAALLFFGCEVTDVTIEDRIQIFQEDLNASSRDGIWDNFDVDGKTNDGVNSLLYWTTGVWTNTDFIIDVQEVVGSTATTLVGHSGTSGLTILPWTFTMVAKVDGFTTTWYIAKIGTTGVATNDVVDNAGISP